MDDKTYATNVSEAKVLADLCMKRFNVFSQTSGKAPFDLVASHESFPMVLNRIQVKSCAKVSKNGSYNVQLKKVRHNKNENKITNFDCLSCDVVAVYLMDVDKVFYIEAKKLHGKTAVAVRLDKDIDYFGCHSSR
jgi:hypothetical protein